MILDSLTNGGLYRGLTPAIALAFDYLQKMNFSELANGRYPVDGERVYAIVNRYTVKPHTEIVWEAHRNYIDVQYLVEGTEVIGYAPLQDDFVAKQPYNKEKDAIFFDPVSIRGDFFELRAGSFAIFFPHDVHAPGLTDSNGNSCSEVFKIVVKCRVEDRNP